MSDGFELIDGAGVDLAVHDLGGDGPDVLVIAHATGFLGRVYRAFADCLSDRFRVVALDFRGHGDSAEPVDESGFGWSHMADDLAAVVDHIGSASPMHAFGHSMGGAAVLEVERRSPGAFASAFVYEPIVPPKSVNMAGDSSLVLSARLRRPEFESAAEALRNYAAKPPLGVFRADVLHDYVEHGFSRTEGGGVSLKCRPDSEASTFSMSGAIRAEHMDSLELPTVVAMSGDGGPPAEMCPHLADLMPNGRLVEFEHLTHFGPLQEPVSVAAALRQHADSVG